MMRSKCRTAAVALLAMLTLGALAATSASATLPEFSPLPKTEKPISFTTSGSGGATFFVSVTSFTCASSVGKGSITSAKGGTVTLTFKGCGRPGGRECSTKGQASGTVITESLPFSLVYTKKEPTKQVAIAFNYKGNTFLTFDCPAGPNSVIRHAILAPVTPINTLTKSLTATFEAPGGIQEPRENYTENLEKLESNFPELMWGEGSFGTEVNLRTAAVLGEFKQSGEKIEEKIVA